MSAILSQTKSSKTRTNLVNVKSYGAKLDGVTNDLPAIKRAIDSITNGVVTIPAGICRIEGTILLKDGITLEGAGSDVTILLLAGAFYTATPVHWDSSPAAYSVIKDKNHTNRVAISLTGGASTHPSNTQTYIKNLSIKPNAAPTTTYDVTAVYGNFVKGGLENVSSTYCAVGALIGLNTSELRGSGKFSNGTYGVQLLSSTNVAIQKVDLSYNTIGLDLLPECRNVDVLNVNFSNCLVASRIGEYCFDINIVTPTLGNILGNPWIIDPTSTKSTQINGINLVIDGYMQEPLPTWEFGYDSAGSGTPSIKKVYDSLDTYLQKVPKSKGRRLLVEPGDSSGFYVQSFAQSLGFLNWEFYARSTQYLRLTIEDATTAIIYDSSWIPGNLSSGQVTSPTRICGSLFNNDDPLGDKGTYTAKIYSSGIHPFFLEELSIIEGTTGYSTLSSTIDTHKGFAVYEFPGPGSYEILALPTTQKERDTVVSFFAKSANAAHKGPYTLGISTTKEGTRKDVCLYDNGDYQYFELPISTSGEVYLHNVNASGLLITALGAHRVYDQVNGVLTVDSVPNGWWAVGSKVLVSGATWICEDNASFPNTFAVERAYGVEYTWSGTSLGIRRENESTYTYTDLSGPALEYSWSGTSLGVRIEGSADPYSYQNLGGISGLQGPAGPTGDIGPSGVEGRAFEYLWDGTSLGVRPSGLGSYEYVDLKGDTGAEGPIGPSGLMGSGLLYDWAGTSLGVKAYDEGSYTYTDLRGPGLEYSWSGMSLGVRVSGTVDYTYTELAGISGLQGPTGATGAKGDTGAAGASGISAVHGKITSNNGFVFLRAADGSYNISTTTLTGAFYRGSAVAMASRTVEIRQLNDQVYEYATIAGAGEATTYTTVRDSVKQTIMVTITHTASATSVSHNVSLVRNGSSLEYDWSGSSLGVRVSGIGAAYSYVNLSGQAGATGSTGATGARGYMGSGLLYDVAGTRIGVKTFDELVYTYTDDLRPSGVNNLEVSGTLYSSYPSGIRMRSTDDLKDFWLYISNSGGSGYQLYIREI